MFQNSGLGPVSRKFRVLVGLSGSETFSRLSRNRHLGPACFEKLIFEHVFPFNGAETNCRIAHILGILLMNSCNTDIFFSNYYHLQSVRFEFNVWKNKRIGKFDGLEPRPCEDIKAILLVTAEAWVRVENCEDHTLQSWFHSAVQILDFDESISYMNKTKKQYVPWYSLYPLW